MRVGVAILLLAVCAATVFVLSPGSSADSGAVAIESGSTGAPGTAGLRVYLDPETGDVGAPPENSTVVQLNDELQNALRQDEVGLQFVTHPDGAVSVDLQGRYESASYVRVDANGKRVYCDNDAEAVARGLGDTTTPTGPEVK